MKAGKFEYDAILYLSDIHITLHDGVVGSFMDTGRFLSEEGWLEEGFWATESFISDGNDLSVRKFIGLLEGGGAGGSGHFLVKVKGDVAEFFLDVTDDFTLGRGCGGVATLSEDLHEVVSQVTPSQVQSKNGMGKCITCRPERNKSISPASKRFLISSTLNNTVKVY